MPLNYLWTHNWSFERKKKFKWNGSRTLRNFVVKHKNIYCCPKPKVKLVASTAIEDSQQLSSIAVPAMKLIIAAFLC